jgi:hypothetical protein
MGPGSRPEMFLKHAEEAAVEKSADVLLSDGSAAHMRQIRREDAPAIV